MGEIPGLNIVNIIHLKARESLEEINAHLEKGLIPFWLKNGIDHEYGGYLTCFDDKGTPTADTDKYIVTQTRMIWGMSVFSKQYPENKQLLEAAKQGVAFFIKYFWDQQYGGWAWKTKRDGSVIDSGKVTYGQVFAIYALAEYTLATGDPVGLEYAHKTFDLLQKYCTDTYRGGYYEKLEPDWEVSEVGFHGGDRKSLDVHMHVMEAFTVLAQCSKKEIHYRKLKEVIDLILAKMIDKTSGAGLNQFDLSFRSIPAVDLRRTWDADREKGETIAEPLETTSYGHNVKLAWLLARAGQVLGEKEKYNEVVTKLVDHALRHGVDHKNGGVYRDGPYESEPYGRDKEWWQNSESLVGFLEAFERFGEEKYFEAFYKTWNFSREHFINHGVGEWRQLLDKSGNVIVGDIGNPWKAIYHTGRSMLECKLRLTRLMDRD